MNMKISALILACMISANLFADNDVRLAVMNFEDLTARPGLTNPDTLAQKGALLLAEQLLAVNNVNIIDRRDFMEKMSPPSSSQDDPSKLRPSYIHAAQLLRADAVVRGSLLSVSTGKRTVNPDSASDSVDFENVTVRVMVQALDTIDGTVLAAHQGKTSTQLRQSKSEKIQLSDEQILTMLEDALKQASSELAKTLPEKIKAKAARERVTISVLSTDDPALVEIDGILVGTTPIQSLQVYKGDHILAISRPNYTPITKRLVLESDVKISIPMFRTDLTAEERKEIYKNADMKIYMMNGKPDILIQSN